MKLDKRPPLIAFIHGGDVVWYSNRQSLTLSCVSTGWMLLTCLDFDPYPASWQDSDSALAFSALSLTIFLSHSVSVPPACLSSGQDQCPSSVHLVPAPNPLCPQVLEWVLPHPLIPQTSSQVIKIRQKMTKMKVVMWPDLVIWYQCFLEYMLLSYDIQSHHQLLFSIYCHGLWTELFFLKPDRRAVRLSEGF